MPPATAGRYHAGETDAIIRRFRGYLRVIEDDATPNDRKPHLLAVICDDFRALDEFLSDGKPLPSQWMNGRDVVQVAGQAGEASTEEIASEKEGT
jgi:hypothetical protein